MPPPMPQSEDQATPSRLSRRGFVVGAVALLALGGVGAARWFNVTAQVEPGDLTAAQALQAAQTGEITLVDIRRPDEWARTGVGAGAIAIDMRSRTFLKELLTHTGGRRDMPIALICARGVRSAALSMRLKEAGFTQILDVPEGMSGSGAGPGWVARGLPVVAPE